MILDLILQMAIYNLGLEINFFTIVKTHRLMQNMVGELRSAMICCVQKLVELSTLAIGHFQTVSA